MWCPAGVADSPFIYSGISSRIFPNVIDHREFQFTHRVLVNGRPGLFVDLTLCDGHFFISVHTLRKCQQER